jgi:type II secretory pathway pseudopilin PulG
MGNHTQTGFTVIEVMLFLAVTGMLAVGILVGSGVTIGQQRYRDSVNSVKSYIQQQYNAVTNTINGRSKGWSCDSAGNVSEAFSGQARGTSDCVVLGRIIIVDPAGTKLTSSNVIGYRTPGAPAGSSDIDEIKLYRLTSSPIEPEIEEVPWGAQIVKPKTTIPQPFSVLIVRSPLSGSILTFTAEGVQPNLNNLVNITNVSNVGNLCLNADIGTFVGKRMEVRIDSGATSQSAVHVPPESESVCD